MKTNKTQRLKQRPLLHVRMPVSLKQAAVDTAAQEERTLAEIVRDLIRKWVDGSIRP